MKRLMTALASIALIGTLFVGAPKPVFAVGGADTFYVGFGGGSDAGCGVPDYDLDYGNDFYWDGDSWEYNGRLKLEDALYEFFDNDGTLDVTDGDTIVICDGWFHLHADGPAWNGDLTPGVDVDPSTITIRGLGVNNTVIDGTEPDDADPYDADPRRPFYFLNTNLILEDMTIINTSSLEDDGDIDGGAIFLNYGSLEINDVDFVNFVAEGGDGGAIQAYDADIDLNNVNFDLTTGVWPYNSDYNDGNGGAIAASSTSSTAPNLVVTIDDSEFNNIGTQDNGGALHLYCASTTITNTAFYDNTAGISGGAIWTSGEEGDCDTTGQLTIDQSVFEGNYIHDLFGDYNDGYGGAVASVYQPVTITDSDFGAVGDGNSAGESGNGGALYVDGTSGTQVTVEDSNFEDNYADDDGGAIFTHCVNLDVTGNASGTSDDFEATLTSVFYSNLADDEDGGAIYIGAEGCNDDDLAPAADDFVTATIEGVFFEENNADDQGGAVATDQDNFNYLSELVVRSSTFFNNGDFTLNDRGGALNSDYVDISIYSSQFIGNRAGFDGGAVEICGGDLVVEDSYFENNHAEDNGGVFYTDDGCGRGDAGNVTITDSEFVSNGAVQNGGVLTSASGDPTVSITGSSFTDNTSGYEGGALDIHDAITSISASVFEGNLAGGEGGAVNLEDSNSLTVRNSEFTDNSSGYNWYGEFESDGGAIDFEGNDANAYLGVFDSLFDGNYATGNGGAIWAGVDETTGLVQIARVSFTGNASDLSGGAMWVDLNDEGTLTVDRSTFSGNRAWEDGGAINQDTDGYDTFVRITNSRFEDNFADSDGGAVDLTDYTVLTANTFIGNETSDDGSSDTDGGAVQLNENYADESLPYLFSVTNNLFSGNWAGWDGGALQINDKAIITGNRFLNNYADEDGGAIDIDDDYADLEGPSVISGNMFSNNRAENDGGALHADYDVVVSSNTFTSNVAVDDGGAFYANNDAIITKNTFVRNSALDNGGAVFADDLNFPESSVTDNLFDSNAATGNGGAMWIDDDEGADDHKLVIASNRITRNTAAENGAGLYITFPGGSPIQTQLMTGIVRNTFERNVSQLNGGAIMMEYRGGSYSNARAALQALKKAAKNNRYKANKANLDRATGDIGGVAIIGFMSEVAEVEPLRTPETHRAK